MIGDWWTGYQPPKFPTVPSPAYPQAPQQFDLSKALLTPENLASVALTGKLPNTGSGPILNTLLNPPRPPAAIPATTGAAPVVPVTSQPLPAVPGASTRDLWSRSPWGASAPTSFTASNGIDPAYIDQLMKGEDFRANPYRDNTQMSIGYGTRWQEGQPVNISPATGKALLMPEVNNALKTVNNVPLPANVTLSPSQRHALIDLTYNSGPGWTGGKIGSAIRKGDFNTAADLLTNYPKTPGRGYATTSGGKYLPGLQMRREWQANLLRQGNAPTAAPAAAVSAPTSAAAPITPRSIMAPNMPAQAESAPIVPRAVRTITPPPLNIPPTTSILNAQPPLPTFDERFNAAFPE